MALNESTGRRRFCFDSLETTAICVIVGAIAAAVMHWAIRRELAEYEFFARPGVLEAEPLKRYGPTRWSRNYEEWIIRDYFQDKRDGVFIDVGANHFRDENNTYFLETALGWSGVAIDALAEFGKDYVKHRPRTKFVAMFASNTEDAVIEFFAADNHLVSSANSDFVRRENATGTARRVPTTTLDAVLRKAGVTKVNFLSMDIELSEPKALAGFDIDRYRPELVCIEAHPEVRQEVLDYFAEHDYVLVGKYLRADPLNLYFRPHVR